MKTAKTKGCLLTINGGSSSIKFALFDAGVVPLPRSALWQGKIDGIDGPAPQLQVAVQRLAQAGHDALTGAGHGRARGRSAARSTLA